jgi:hypothetical protein
MPKVIATWIAFTRALTPAAIALLLACTPREFKYSLPGSDPLSEAAAIEWSRRALRDAGLPQDMQPITYWPTDTANVKERFFARNDTDPNRGHVLWKLPRGTLVWDYHVALIRSTGQVVCVVRRAK